MSKERIYRVYPADKRPRPIPRLDKLDTRGLVAALESENGWQRDTAQRLLLHRTDHNAIAAFGPLTGDRHQITEDARVQAIWTLFDLNYSTNHRPSRVSKMQTPASARA